MPARVQSGGAALLWPSLRSLAADLATQQGYTINLAVSLAQAMRSQTADLGVTDTSDWTRLGVMVHRRPLATSGMLVRREFPLQVWVNKDDDWRRQRFTIGHEIAHYLLPSRSHLPVQLLEQLCDAFAAELLLPLSRVRSRLTATGGLASAYDVLELANEARINISPVLNQVARASWDPGFGIILMTAETGIPRVRAGAGPQIGSPPRGQRLSSLGRWRILRRHEGRVAHSAGIADLHYRFIRPLQLDMGGSVSGRLRGIARWNSVELMGKRTIIVVNFLYPPDIKLSKRTGSS